MEIGSLYGEILDGLTEEEKEAETINEAKSAFIATEVVKEVRLIKAALKQGESFTEEAYEMKILRVQELITEEKRLKKELKTEKPAFHLQTKATIEALTHEQVNTLLEKKWVVPIVTSINNLPQRTLQELTKKVQILAKKYATTYSDIAGEISKAESTLADMIGELTGSEFDMAGLDKLKSLFDGR